MLTADNTTTVSWSSQNVTSCAIHGINGDSWTDISSSGKTSSAIQSQTAYTLHCIGYAGANPSSVDKSVIVNIIPTFIER